MSLPEVKEVRCRIESCKYKPYRMYLESLYLCGAARSVEMAGKRCSGENPNIILGPHGSDVFLSETPPPDPTWLEVLEIDDNLIEQVKKKFPEMERFSPTDIADWAMRKTLKDA